MTKPELKRETLRRLAEHGHGRMKTTTTFAELANAPTVPDTVWVEVDVDDDGVTVRNVKHPDADA